MQKMFEGDALLKRELNDGPDAEVRDRLTNLNSEMTGYKLYLG